MAVFPVFVEMDQRDCLIIGGGQVYVLLFDVRYKPGAHQAQGLDYLKIQFDNLPLPL